MKLFLFLAIYSSSFAANTTASSVSTVISGLNNITRGDTLTISPGDYTIGTDVIVGRSSTANSYMVIRALQKGTATLRAGNGDQMLILDKKFVVFENITFNGQTSVSHCIHIKPGSGNIIVRNCTFIGTIDKAVKSSSPDSAYKMPVDSSIWQDYQLYENCEAYPGTGNTQAGGMLNINGPDYVTVRGNYIHDYNGGALYCVFVKAGGRYAIFENNYITNCIVGLSFGGGKTGALWQRRGSIEALDGICRNNVLVNMSDAGLHCNYAQDCKFINNTCINMWGIQNQTSTNIAATNNILMGGSFRGTFVQTTNYVASYNAAFFWDPANKNYRLKSTATALVGKGTADTNCKVDFLNRTRANPPSIGAYEMYSSGTETASEALFKQPEIKLSVSPNPMAASTKIKVNLKTSIPLLDLTVVDTKGRVVYGLAYERAAAGTHTFVWSGNNHEGQRAAPGNYFIRLSLGEKTLIKQLILIR